MNLLDVCHIGRNLEELFSFVSVVQHVLVNIANHAVIIHQVSSYSEDLSLLSLHVWFLAVEKDINLLLLLYLAS